MSVESSTRTISDTFKMEIKSRMSSFCLLKSLRLSQFWPSATGNNVCSFNNSCGMYQFKVLQFDEVGPKSKMNPKARSGHRIVADNAGDIYSFGGFNMRAEEDQDLAGEEEWIKYKPLFQELWKYNWHENKWTKLRTRGEIPDKLVSHCMCYWNEKIIIYGGTGLPYGDNSSNKLTIYHIAKNYWEAITPLSDPSRSPMEMYGQACVCDEQKGEIYVVGGTNGSQYSCDVHKFNLYTKKWTVLYRSTENNYGDPGCRYRHEIALKNNKLYLFGGSTSHQYYSFDRLPVFDLETRDWTFIETTPYRRGRSRLISFPMARKCHSLVVIDSDCYMCGGTDSEKVFSDVWHINLNELKWTRIVDKIPYPVYFHGASISPQGKMSVFGGVENVEGDSRNNKLTYIWLKIPTLKTICLSSLNYYVRNKVITSKAIQSTGLKEAIEISEH